MNLSHWKAGHASEVVTLLHPVGLDSTWWYPYLVLRDRYTIVAPDLRGHGRSPLLDPNIGQDLAASDVIELWDELGIETSHVIGASLGGMVAQVLAELVPGRVESLALISTAATFSDEARDIMRRRAAIVAHQGMDAIRIQTVERWLTKRAIAEDPSLVHRIEVQLLSQSKIAHAAYWRGMADLMLPDRCRTEIPVLVIVGDEDVSTTVDSAKVVAARFPSAVLQVLKGGAHMVAFEDPEPVIELVREHLERAPSRRPRAGDQMEQQRAEVLMVSRCSICHAEYRYGSVSGETCPICEESLDTREIPAYGVLHSWTVSHGRDGPVDSPYFLKIDTSEGRFLVRAAEVEEGALELDASVGLVARAGHVAVVRMEEPRDTHG